MASRESMPAVPAREAIDAVIFDWDGVLARTMEDNFQAWKHALAPQGVELPRRAYFLLEGIKASEVARHFLAGPGLGDADMAALAAAAARRKDEYFLAHARNELYPAAEACASHLAKAGKPLALVTGASRSRIQGSRILDRLPAFAAVITADDVAQGKPHPEPYLKALERLGKPAARCLVVENAPLGIRAAKAAGIRCVALATTLPPQDLAEADAVLGGLEELIPWMQP